MKASPMAFDLIKLCEGLRLKAYLCSAGKWTIGWGSTKGVTKGMTITLEQAVFRLLEEVSQTEQDLNSVLKREIPQHQYDALVSWMFNLGLEKTKEATILRKLNAGQEDVGSELERWVYERNPKTGLMQISPGLVNRRKKERQLFDTGVLPVSQTVSGKLIV